MRVGRGRDPPVFPFDLHFFTADLKGGGGEERGDGRAREQQE